MGYIVSLRLASGKEDHVSQKRRKNGERKKDRKEGRKERKQNIIYACMHETLYIKYSVTTIYIIFMLYHIPQAT